MKKIIGILVCTLLIVTAIPVTGQIKEIFISKDYQEIIKKAEPDFIVRKIELEYAYGGDIGDRVAILTGIDNMGSPVEKMSVRLRLSFEDYPEFTTDHVMEYEGNGLKYHGNPWPGLIRPLRNKCIYTLIVEVDPDNEIPESNDENNVKTKTVIFLPRFNEIFSKKVTNDVIRPCSNGDKWMKTFGGSGYNHGNSVQQTSDGGYIIVGQTSPSLDLEYDIWLIKTDGMGNKIWDKKFGGDGHDRGESVKQTSDGGYIITGSTESYGAGNRDVWLIKTDSNGNMMWDKTFGDSGNDSGFEVIEISSGGYIIVGSTHLNEPWYRADLWLIKTDSDGNMIWDKTFEDEGHGVGMSVQEVNDGGFIITGQISSTGYADLWLLKTDSEGELLWDKKFDKYDNVDMGNSVMQTADGGFIIGGSTLLDGLSVYDALLIKTDSEGNILWDKTFGGYGYDFGNSVQQTSDGGYIIAGFTEDIFFKTDGLLIKTDINGEKEWIKTYHLSRSGIIYSAQQTTDGGYILTGTVSHNLLSDDIWLIKTDANGDVPTSRARNLLKFRLLELFPNLFKILEYFLR